MRANYLYQLEEDDRFRFQGEPMVYTMVSLADDVGCVGFMDSKGNYDEHPCGAQIVKLQN